MDNDHTIVRVLMMASMGGRNGELSWILRPGSIPERGRRSEEVVRLRIMNGIAGRARAFQGIGRIEAAPGRNGRCNFIDKVTEMTEQWEAAAGVSSREQSTTKGHSV